MVNLAPVKNDHLELLNFELDTRLRPSIDKTYAKMRAIRERHKLDVFGELDTSKNGRGGRPCKK